MLEILHRACGRTVPLEELCRGVGVSRAYGAVLMSRVVALGLIPPVENLWGKGYRLVGAVVVEKKIGVGGTD